MNAAFISPFYIDHEDSWSFFLTVNTILTVRYEQLIADVRIPVVIDSTDPNGFYWTQPYPASISMSVRHSTIPPRNAFVCIHGTDRQCGAWGKDMNGDGWLRAHREPAGKQPVAVFYGVIWFYMVGAYFLVGNELKQHIPWLWGSTRDKMDGIISIGWVAALAGMSIDDFEVVEFLHHAKEEGEEYDAETSKGTKSARTLGTTMRTDFRAKVDTFVIPDHWAREAWDLAWSSWLPSHLHPNQI